MGASCVVGVDLGGTKVTAGAVSSGAVRRLESRRIPPGGSEDAVLAEIFAAIAAVSDESAIGIGVGVPSVVELATGVVLEVENIPAWRRVPLRAILEQRFGLPTYVNNDANAFAVGEHRFGRGRGFRDLVGMTLGTGLGAGLIIDGRLHSGRNCGAGELGSIPYRDGTIEDYCSGRFFLREYGVAGEVLEARARRGEDAAVEGFARFGREVAAVMMLVACALDPEAVILGGSVSGCFDLFAPAMRARLEAFGYSHVTGSMVIEPSEMKDAAVLGAAALYLDATGRR
ncbi:MAG: ROK family protein [Acidobacteria bacterium]|nr:ROK family protein [Acidobacteriota bacterium]